MDQEEIDRILAGYEEMNTSLRESLESRNVTPASRQQAVPPVGVTSQALTPEEVARAQEVGAGAEPTAEEQLIITSGEGDWFTTYIAAQNAAVEQEQKLAWVIQILQPSSIQTIDDLDFNALYQRIRQRGDEAGSLADLRNMALDEDPVEFKQRIVEEFLAQGPNLLQRTVLESWAATEGLIARNTKIDTPHGDVWSWQVDEIAASNPALVGFEVDLIGLAREHGVDPLAAAALYTTALEMGRVDGFTTTREVVQRGRGGRAGVPSDRLRGGVREVTTFDTQAEGDLFGEYKAGMDLYGSDAIFAQLHALNPALAAKLADPESAYTTITRDEWTQVQDIIREMNPNVTGWRNTTAAWMERGYEAVGHDGSGDGSGGVIINKGQVRESLRQLSQSWNLGNVSDSELESLVGGFVSESLSRVRSQAPHPLDFLHGIEPEGDRITDTPSAQEFLRQTDRYRDLYGRKTAGESEEEYAFRFQSAAHGFLGDIGSNMGFEQAGMRTGDIQTTIGQAAVSPEASGSSTFLGRMARSAEVVRGMT